MKKLICLILAAAILILPTACGNTSKTDSITEPNGESVDFGEPEDLAAQYKEYFLKSLNVTGGAGYNEESDQMDRVSFTGDEIRLNVRLANDRFSCDQRRRLHLPRFLCPLSQRQRGQIPPEQYERLSRIRQLCARRSQ